MARLLSILASAPLAHFYDTGIVKIEDVIVPEVFNGYVQVTTEEKSRLVRSGAVSVDSGLAALLGGGGLTFNQPSWGDLDHEDEENVSNDDPDDMAVPNKIGTQSEIQIRLSRNNSWSSMNLVNALIAEDPMTAIGDRVAAYWAGRMQRAFIATLAGIFADNDAAPTGTDTHTAGDLTHDVSNGGVFEDGVTNFSTEHYMDTKVLLGDSMEKLSMVMMHSIVYNRALKNNLIDFISDSVNGLAVKIATFMGAEVIVDDMVTNADGVFQTWLFGPGAFKWGNGSAKVPTEFERIAGSGNGAGQDVLYNRVEWCIHPVGYAYIGVSPPKGGPANTTGTAPLNAAASWSRVFPERKQIAIARLITTEY